MFGALMYSCQVWGNLDKMAESILKIERKAIKACLGVKQGTSNNIIYAEIDKPNMISVIKLRQYNFFLKFCNLEEDESIGKSIWFHYVNYPDLGKTKETIHYYCSLEDNITNSNKATRF